MGQEQTTDIDSDIAALSACVEGLKKSSSRRMLRANILYLWDRFVVHPVENELLDAETHTLKPTRQEGEDGAATN